MSPLERASDYSDPSHEIDFTPHPGMSAFEKGDKVVFYQENPLPNWGPAARARNTKAGEKATDDGEGAAKRKADALGEREEKRAKVSNGEEEATNA